jgi:plastocyanin
MTRNYGFIASSLGGLLWASSVLGPALRPKEKNEPASISAKLSEWKVELSEATIAAGAVRFTATNAGSIPHALEVEGPGIEHETDVIQPGNSATLTLTLRPGTYEVYCPVGVDSHKKLGMETHLKVVSPSRPEYPRSREIKTNLPQTTPGAIQAIQVTGGGPVIQILPGPFPFADSAAPILKQFGNEREGLESQAQNGPYSNNVAPIAGTFTFTAWDKGATSDSVNGVAEFTTQDHARWKLVLDRVQTKDVSHHPRFGGVILGLYYHGITGVHTPLVPTINSAVALWAFGHLYRNGTKVTDDAMVHVMQLSRTRRDGDFALACWDCSKNKIEELQLQVLPASGEPKFDAPGGFLFVNWEKSRSSKSAG